MASKAAIKGPSNKPQFFNNGGAWYYEDNASISVYRSCSTDGAGVGRITVRKLAASLERMGYKVTKPKKKGAAKCQNKE